MRNEVITLETILVECQCIRKPAADAIVEIQQDIV